MPSRLTAAAAVGPRNFATVRQAAGSAWCGGDLARALAWFGVAVLIRAPLTARVEGVLDHDQSIVGLMALDIAAGRRWPVFFDGQRYMGAIEPYVSALFVALLGHSPASVALSPLMFFGLFVASQYVLWRRWADRPTGHAAAVIALIGAPMLVLWSVVPRGGYIELLAWALPVLVAYRGVTRPGAPPLNRWRQAGWGFLLALGYFVNPLSLIVYATLAIDWTFGRHGADLRRERRLSERVLSGAIAPVLALAAVSGLILALGVCCHVVIQPGAGRSPYVFVLGSVPPPWGPVLGAAGTALILGGAAVWTGAAGRAWRLTAEHPWFALGALAAMLPSLLFRIGLSVGWYPSVHSLPIWIRAPWDVGVNLRDGVIALGTLLGCSPHAPATVLIGQGIVDPPAVWPLARGVLAWLAPVTAGVALLLVGTAAWNDRARWQRFFRLKGDEPATGTQLALLGVVTTGTLYVLQATSPNASSVRYLVPAWIFLPGLLAGGLRVLPKSVARVAGAAVLGTWLLAQVNLWMELDRPSPLRPLAESLERRGVRGIVAETPVALMVTNLSHGRVGAVEFRSNWPRLAGRYLDRFPAGHPIACVVDTGLVSYSGIDASRATSTDIGPAIRELALRYPERVRLGWELDHYQVWEVDLPLSTINSGESETARLSRSPAATRLPSRASVPRSGRMEDPLRIPADSTTLTSAARPTLMTQPRRTDR